MCEPSIEDRIKELEDRVSVLDFNESINQLIYRIDALDNRIANLETKVQYLQNDSHSNHYDLENQISSVKREVENLRTNLRYGTGRY